jgi:hypothetical protein
LPGAPAEEQQMRNIKGKAIIWRMQNIMQNHMTIGKAHTQCAITSPKECKANLP